MAFNCNRAVKILIVFSTVLSACGPKVVSKLAANATLPSSVAVLPSDYAIDMPRERIDYLRKAVISELRNSRFVVVDDKVVQSICKTPKCEDRKSLENKYVVDGYINLAVSSASKNNFLAGYYNAIDGDLSFTDTKGAELIKVTHTQSERGGLLFNTGQIFQGFISQAKGTGDEAFYSLADKFARTLVRQLPAPKTGSASEQPEGSAIFMDRPAIRWVTPAVFSVCAKGTPNSFATLLAGGRRAGLRETTPGNFCGTFAADAFAGTAQQATVELRSAFGDTSRQDIALNLEQPCKLEGLVSEQETKQGVELTLQCIDVKGNEQGETCSAEKRPCEATKLLVYRAPSPAGPYKKLREVTSATWVDSSAPKGSDSTYQVVAINRSGLRSLPASPQTEQK